MKQEHETGGGGSTGWRAAKSSRRPHTAQRLRRNPQPLNPSKKRRTQSKDRQSALRLKGLL